MSIATKRNNIQYIRSRKQENNPILCLTATSAPMAGILDNFVDILLVGDSLGMVVYGFESTLPVTLEMMIAHGGAVVRGSQKALVVVDMPFGSYQESPAQAFRNASRILSETGCQAVKLEGGQVMAETVRYLVERGIPVMGHVGLLPQSVHQHSGYKQQGKTKPEHARILADAKAIAEAGAFSLVIEHVTEALGREITKKIAIPTIGIGASPACDGQVVVTEDMLGLFEKVPSFVKPYGALRKHIQETVQKYCTATAQRKHE